MDSKKEGGLSAYEEKKMKRAIEFKARRYDSLSRDNLVSEANELFSENYQLKLEATTQKKIIADLEYQVKKLSLLLEKEGVDKMALENMPRNLRIKEIIRSNKKVMTTREVWEVLRDTEPNLQRDWNNPLNVMTTLLSRLVDSKELQCYRSRGNSGYYYGLPEWFDENEKIKRNFGL